MKTVSIREFQQKANDYLLTLPITLTRYGEPVAQITAIEKGKSNVLTHNENVLTHVSTDKAEIPECVNTPFTNLPKWAEKIIEDIPEPRRIEKCSFPTCGEEATEMGVVYSPDEMEWVESPMCKKHADKSRKESNA